MSAKPHWSSMAPTKGIAPTTCVSTRVRASMLQLLDLPGNYPIAQNAKATVPCLHQPPPQGAEREELARVRALPHSPNSGEFGYARNFLPCPILKAAPPSSPRGVEQLALARSLREPGLWRDWRSLPGLFANRRVRAR